MSGLLAGRPFTAPLPGRIRAKTTRLSPTARSVEAREIRAVSDDTDSGAGAGIEPPEQATRTSASANVSARSIGTALVGLVMPL